MLWNSISVLKTEVDSLLDAHNAPLSHQDYLGIGELFDLSLQDLSDQEIVNQKHTVEVLAQISKVRAAHCGKKLDR
jgi:hypothetical protein